MGLWSEPTRHQLHLVVMEKRLAVPRADTLAASGSGRSRRRRVTLLSGMEYTILL